MDRSFRAGFIMLNIIGLTNMTTACKFTWKNVRFFYCACLMIIHLLIIIGESLVVMNLLSDSEKKSLNRQLIRSVNYILKSSAHIIYFYILAKNQTRLTQVIRNWRNLESIQNRIYGVDYGVKKRLIILIVVVVSLRILALLLGNGMRAIFGTNLTFDEYLTQYAKNSRKGIHQIFGDFKPAAFVILIVGNVSTMEFEFIGVLLTIVCQTISTRWRILSDTLKIRVKQNLHDVNWVTTRQNYIELVRCTDEFDKYLSSLIFVYVIFGMYSLLYRLHNGLTGLPHQTIYRCYYFLHYCCLMFAVILSAAKIPETAEEISDVMDMIKKTGGNENITRFELRCRQPLHGMTGHRFFYLNRSFVLFVVGAIFTYEIVLLQLT
ncbi:Uncharacterised protein g1134 [Pycnogonum litorale]